MIVLTCGYVIVMYDVGENRVNKVYRICKKYLYHFQNSIFRGEITTSLLVKLKAELMNVIDVHEDFICIFECTHANVFEECVLGVKDENGESLLL